MSTGSESGLDRHDIAATEKAIRPRIRRTPVVQIEGVDFGLSVSRVSLKLEFLQHSGSFKTRGAFANLLLRDIPKVGVVAASGGNHGAAVAYAAMKLGIPAKIFVPRVASIPNIRRIRDCGAELVIHGERYADALTASEAWVTRSGALAVHAFDQRETLLGQGTIGLELEEQAPSVDTLLVSVGGGGLIGGISAWYARNVKVVGVEPRGSPTLTRALAAGAPVDAEAGESRWIRWGRGAGASRSSRSSSATSPRSFWSTTTQLAERRSFFGKHCASSSNLAEPPPSRRCCPVNIDPKSASMSASSCAAPIPPP